MKKQLLLFIFSISCSLALVAKNYYTDSKNGLDTNDGLSPAKAWKSFAKVKAAALIAGDTVFFKAGSLFTQSNQFDIKKSGKPSSPVVFTAYGEGVKPQFVNTSTSPWALGIVIAAKWVVIDGLMVKDIGNAAISIQDGGGNTIIRNCEVTGSGAGVNLNGKYNLVTECYFHHLKMIVNDTAPDNDFGAAAVGVGQSNNEISYNRMDSCFAPSHDYGEDGGAIELYAEANVTIDSCYFHHNTAYDTNGFLEAGGQTSAVIKGIRVAYNQYINKRGAEISWLHFLSGGNFGIDIQDIRYENNTFVAISPTFKNYGAFGWDGTPKTSSALTLKNNIIYTGNRSQIFSGPGKFTSTHNLYFKTDGTKTIGFTKDATDQIINPLFENPAANNYHLQATSPAINKGMELGYTTDIENKPIQGLPDQGAYEYEMNTGLNNYLPKSTGFKCYPNPTSGFLTIKTGETEENQQVQILNSNGITVKEVEINETAQINITCFANGIYFVRLKGQSLQIQKFMKL
jgi:hypothetical protein